MDELLRAAAVPFAPLIGMAPPMRRAMQGRDMGPLAAALLRRVRDHPDDANGLLDAAAVLQLLGQPDAAMLLQQRALDLQTSYSLPAETPEMVLLVIMGPGELMWNTPVELLLEGAGVSLELLYLTAHHPWPETVPQHDAMLVAMAESDANRPLLRRLAEATPDWPRAVINAPERIAALSRDSVSALLAGADGVVMPPTWRTAREAVRDEGYPQIIRPTDSHAGRDLALLTHGGELRQYLAQVDAAEFYLSPFIDYRSADGLYRKYRVALIDGRPFISHMGISSHWMIHYLNAGMEHSAAKRAEEAERMHDFDSGFAQRHALALQQIHQRAGLDYLTIDCAETADGQLLVFEIGTAMAVHAMDDEQLFPYKQPAMRKLFAAFRQMLDRRRR
ncbi:ATP-grasp domain-containing protein [Duganella aquatilis]|nr:RimK family alpha-L-glutamate ligase [Duganella aquatilis]